MAKPIKDTPTLKGKDAKRFLEKLEKSGNKKTTPQKLAKMKENFSRLNSIARF